MVVYKLNLVFLVLEDTLKALNEVELVLDADINLRFDLLLDFFDVLVDPLNLLLLSDHRGDLVGVLFERERHSQRVAHSVNLVWLVLHIDIIITEQFIFKNKRGETFNN